MVNTIGLFYFDAAGENIQSSDEETSMPTSSLPYHDIHRRKKESQAGQLLRLPTKQNTSIEEAKDDHSMQ
jgi:hypothetical protein